MLLLLTAQDLANTFNIDTLSAKSKASHEYEIKPSLPNAGDLKTDGQVVRKNLLNKQRLSKEEGSSSKTLV